MAPAGLAAAQEPTDELERLEEWPELENEAEAAKELARLRKARTPAMGEQAHEAILAIGPALVPDLVRALHKERDEDARERVVAVLDALTDARHTRLLAREFRHESAHVRTWALARAALFPDAGTRAGAEEALAAVRATREEDREPGELVVAALAVTAAGSLEGMDVLHELAQRDDAAARGPVRTALEAVRGPEASALVSRHLAGEREQKLGALRLLAGCGDPESARAVAPFLDGDDNALRIAAINALRGALDGDPPLEKVSAFEAIEIAAKWKSRIPR